MISVISIKKQTIESNIKFIPFNILSTVKFIIITDIYIIFNRYYKKKLRKHFLKSESTLKTNL